jgi:hypothetical protein
VHRLRITWPGSSNLDTWSSNSSRATESRATTKPFARAYLVSTDRHLGCAGTRIGPDIELEIPYLVVLDAVSHNLQGM